MNANKDKLNQSIRYPFLDVFRGFAVLLMIIFHFSYDLSFFHFVKINFLKDPFWFYFPRLIVLLFMISVGVSLNLVHQKKMNWKSFKKRQIKLFFSATLISIATYIMFPKEWIYFGTLHCIFLSSFLALPFIGKKWLSLLVTLIIFAIELAGITIPWIKLTQSSLDYIEPFPWFGFVSLGIFLQSFNFHKIPLSKPMSKPISKTNSTTLSPLILLTYLGKHSLIIYLIHQPILFSLVYLASKFL